MLLDEFEGFHETAHDDQVDAVSGAFEQLRHRGAPDAWRFG